MGSVVAALFVFYLRSAQKGTVIRQFLPVLATLISAYFIKLVLPSTSGMPGLKAGSDAGRIFIAECYSWLPFTGHNRFIYGIGFHRQRILPTVFKVNHLTMHTISTVLGQYGPLRYSCDCNY